MSAHFKRSDYFKLREGDNKVLILTEPIHFRTAYNIGIVYEGSGYNDIAASKYSCYAIDLNDGKVKMLDFSNTIAKQLVTLSEGHYTKFDSYPIPYIINIQAKGAGTKAVKYSVIALEPMEPTTEQLAELATFDTIADILDRKKKLQQNQMNTDEEYQTKTLSLTSKAREDRIKEKAKRDAGGDIPTIQIEDADLDDEALAALVDQMD